jgi:hypothetical protein
MIWIKVILLIAHVQSRPLFSCLLKLTLHLTVHGTWFLLLAAVWSTVYLGEWCYSCKGLIWNTKRLDF